MKKWQKIFSTSLLALILLLGHLPATAQDSQTTLVEFEALKKMVESDTTLDKGIFPYMQSVLTKAELVEALNKYKKAFPTDQQLANTMFKDALRRTCQQVNAYHFSKEQAKALFLGEVDLEVMPNTNPAPPYDPSTDQAKTKQGMPVYFNGKGIALNDTLVKDNKTYVQLREFCKKVNISVDWVSYKFRGTPIPGGNFLSGINLTNPTFVYTAKIPNYYTNSPTQLMAVEITGIYETYQNQYYPYHFVDDEKFRGLVINTGSEEKHLPLTLHYNMGRMYVSVDEFREKIQPYLVDICMQPVK